MDKKDDMASGATMLEAPGVKASGGVRRGKQTQGRILIADGSAPARQLLAAALAQAGYRVIEAADGTEALRLVRHYKPELVIADVRIPGLGVYELVRRIRAEPDNGVVRVILHSPADFDDEAGILASALGAARCVRRPLAPAELLPLVREVLHEPPPQPVPAVVLKTLEAAFQHVMTGKLMEKTAELERELVERRQLETVVRSSERRFAALVESAMDAIISVDADQRIVLFNGAAEDMFRCPAADALGSNLDRFIPARYRASHAEHIRRFAATGTTSRAMGRLGALSGQRSDGVEFPIEASISQVEVEGKRFFTVILRDISERKRLEEALQRMNADLERRVEARTAQLMHANEALVRSNLELQQFAYIAAHDLQTPLRSISGFAQLLHKDYQGCLDDNGIDLVQRVVSNTQRMRTLIQDLLVYSRIDSRGRPFRPTDFRQLFDEVVTSQEAVIRDTGAELTRGDLPVVVGDRGQLAQLLHNLVDNGLKYHGSDPPRVHVSARREGSEWLFSVRDNGIGIASRHHQRIFEVFRRLHTQQAYPGTGIGLALCRRVIERHGGRIWVESEPGQGGVFHFTLPIDGTEPRP